MPLFSSRRRTSDENIAQSERETRHAEHEAGHADRHRSMPSAFSRSRGRTSSESPPGDNGNKPARSGSFLKRFRDHPSGDLQKDPAIQAAQQKVTDAEHAERDADKALEMARSAVRSARQHVRELEAAALEEAKRARAKQREAKSIRKGADRLGRHDNH